MKHIDPNDEGSIRNLAVTFGLSEHLVRAVIVRVRGDPDMVQRELSIHAAAA